MEEPREGEQREFQGRVYTWTTKPVFVRPHWQARAGGRCSMVIPPAPGEKTWTYVRMDRFNRAGFKEDWLYTCTGVWISSDHATVDYERVSGMESCFRDSNAYLALEGLGTPLDSVTEPIHPGVSVP